MKRWVLWAVLFCLAMPVPAWCQANKDLDPQILGAWTLDLTDPEGVHRAPMVIVGRQYDKYFAWYLGNDQPEAFRDVELRGETLAGTLQPKEFPSVTLTVEATLAADNKCSGTAKYREANTGHSGSFRFTGQQLSLSAFDEVMTWKIHFMAPDNKKHEATVTVVTKDGKMHAWFSGRDHELPARGITVDGDRVAVNVSAQTEKGQPVEVTFRGTVAGDTVRGDAEYRIGAESGSVPFQGRRES
jgi:hypothetical protein